MAGVVGDERLKNWPEEHGLVLLTDRQFAPVRWALFSSEKPKVFGIVTLSFVCDKYYLIMD